MSLTHLVTKIQHVNSSQLYKLFYKPIYV